MNSGSKNYKLCMPLLPLELLFPDGVVAHRHHSLVESWLLLSFRSLSGPSATMKASSQGGGFRVRSSLGPLGSVSKMHGVFSNRDLPTTSGRQPMAIIR